MIYKYKIRKKARKFIDSQDVNQRQRILRAIYLLPFLGDIVKIAGRDNLYRLRVGDCRIIFSIDIIEEEETVTLIDVSDAGNRGQIYNKY